MINAVRGLRRFSSMALNADMRSKYVLGSLPMDKCIVLASANWCERSKELSPVLDKVCSLTKGSLSYYMLDVDEVQNSKLIHSLKITSVPTTLAIVNGRVIDSISGLPNQFDFNTFIKKLKQHANIIDDYDTVTLLQKADESMQMRNIEAAVALYQQVLIAEEDISNQKRNENPGFLSAIIGGDISGVIPAKACAGLLRAAVFIGDMDEANHIQKIIKSTFEKHLSIPVVNSAVELHNFVLENQNINIDETISTLRVTPEDVTARLSLASALFPHQAEEAVAQVMIVLNKDASNTTARQMLLKFIQMLGNSDPVTKIARSKLANIVLR